MTTTASPNHLVHPTFSVATPTRNDLFKLQRCIGSIRGQRTEVTVEHLIHDALSADGTAAWLAKRPDLSWVSEADKGMYDAVNRAWARSSGEILSWLNADEQYLPGTLAKVQRYFEAHPSTDVLFGDYIVCNAYGAPIAQRQEIPFRPLYVANSFLNVQSCTLFFRRRLLERGWLHFDHQLRYAADKDLMLRLASRHVRVDHLRDYLSLFGVDGSNLSTHPQMQSEAESVRLKHGAFRQAPVRAVILLGRRVERLLSGAYGLRRLQYRFAEDEVPHYREVCADKLGGRYSLADANSI